MSWLRFAFVPYKKAVLEKSEVSKLRKAEQEIREVLKNLTEEDVDYLLNLFKSYIYTGEVLRKRTEKLNKAEELINNIKERSEIFKL